MEQTDQETIETNMITPETGGLINPDEWEDDDVEVLDEETGSLDAKAGSILYEIIETLLLAAAIWLAVNFATARYIVEGESMEPSLHSNQYLIVSKMAYMRLGEIVTFGEPQRGDIIVFDYPGNPSDDYVKRIIGIPGDEVIIEENGQVVVNGYDLEESYLPEIDLPYRKKTGTWIVPEDMYFVLGDNRNHSSDSRSWGYLQRDYIVGKSWLSYWPLNEVGFSSHVSYDIPENELPDE